MIAITGTFIGGLGLFLLAVSMITDGLKLAAGDALRSVLARSTETRLRGVASGMLLTGIVQSSSAVTVATIGFVNAGLLSLIQALGVVYGANVGTTMTGWIVAAVGFSFKVEAFALPLIGIGMMARMLRPHSRLGSVGEALAGFGLFFIGVDLLKEAFEVFSTNVDVAEFAPHGGIGVMLYVLLGFFMTLVTQSSSAAIAITLTAATGGVLGLNAAAAMVIGANVGTTSTAAFAVIGATSNARRVAAAHVVFNLLTGTVALLLLPLLMWVVSSTSDALGLQEAPAVFLALFHTIFNVLGLLLMWPLTGRLAAFLARQFVTESERFARPLHLDRNVLAAPSLAMEALRLELDRLAGSVREFAAGAISSGSHHDRATVDREQGLRALIDAVESFVGDMQMDKLPEAQRGDLPNVLRISGYLEDVVGLAVEHGEHRNDIEAIMRPAVETEVAAFQAAVVEQIGNCDLSGSESSIGELDEGYKRLRSEWHDLKSLLLNATTARRIPVSPLNSALEGLRTELKMAEQLTKASQRLWALGLTEARGDEGVDEGGDEGSDQKEEASAADVAVPAGSES